MQYSEHGGVCDGKNAYQEPCLERTFIHPNKLLEVRFNLPRMEDDAQTKTFTFKAGQCYAFKPGCQRGSLLIRIVLPTTLADLFFNCPGSDDFIENRLFAFTF